jgi:uncharacterized membrane protein
MFRRTAWFAMTFLALAVAVYAATVLMLPELRPIFIRERLTTMPVAVYLHLFASALALAVGPFQFLGSLRARALAVHRWLGRVYLGGSVLGGLAGLALSTVSQGGLVAHLGFGLLAIGWVATSAAAYAAIRAGNVPSHRRWMTRSFALALAAVTLRLYIPLSALLGIPFGLAYPAIAWLCWVPNLIAAEWFVVGPVARRRGAAAG